MRPNSTITTKRCRGCNETKDIQNFYWREDRQTHFTLCIVCWNKHAEDRRRASREKALTYPGGEKRCWRCKQSKPYADFPRCSTNSSGFSKACRPCNAILHSLWYEKNRLAQPEPPAEKRCRCCKENKARVEFSIDRASLDGLKQWCRECSARAYQARKRPLLYSRPANIRHDYGLSTEGYDAIIQRQNNRCAICGKTPPRLVVDHDHKTDAIRGMLCSPCNQFLAVVEIAGMVESAQRYLILSKITGDLRPIVQPNGLPHPRRDAYLKKIKMGKPA
jgi:hypothetical protein